MALRASRTTRRCSHGTARPISVGCPLGQRERAIEQLQDRPQAFADPLDPRSRLRRELRWRLALRLLLLLVVERESVGRRDALFFQLSARAGNRQPLTVDELLDPQHLVEIALAIE